MPKALKRTDPRLLKALSDPLGETPDHTLGIYLLSAFGYTEKLPVYEVAPWTVRYQASPADLTDGRYAAALADIIGRPRVVVDSIVAVTADVSDRWARQLGQIDLARVLGAALSHGNPVIARLTDGSAFIDPRSIRALASATDFISAVQSGTWNIGTLTSITNPVTVQATDLDIRDLTTTERTPLGSQGQPLQQQATTYELKVREQDLPVATTPTLYNVTMTYANTEYSQAVTATVRKFLIATRDRSAFRFAWTTGKVATPTEPYMSVAANEVYYEDYVKMTNPTFYFASASAGKVIELEVWT
jgi:hypothetical protein